MEWHDQGIILSLRRHGETAVIAELLTSEHGRALGLVHGGRSRLKRPMLQPGNSVDAKWRARLDEHLGVFTLEPLQLNAGFIMEEPLRLAGLTTLCALAQLLPEREPHRPLYDAFHIVLASIADDSVWPALLVRWEMGLLEELGFGLDLAACAATGTQKDLAYVSPRSGRAVSPEAGDPWRDRLLPLPAFLRNGSEATAGDILDGLRLTGHFLEHRVFEPRGLKPPETRTRILRILGESVSNLPPSLRGGWRAAPGGGSRL